MLGRWIVAAVVALVIPVAGLVAVTFSEAQMERDWLAAVETQYGDVPADQEGEVSLRALCADPAAAADLAEGCNDTRIFGALTTLNVVALALSLVLLLVSGGIVLVSRGSRSRMAALFRPGLTFLLIGLALLIVAEGLIVVGVLWEVMLLVGRVYPFVILGVALAVLVGIFGVLRALFAMIRPGTVEAAGVELSRELSPAVFAEVEDVARELGTEPPEVIVAGLEPTFYVVDADVQTFERRHRGRVMFLSVPVCRLFSRAELRAVVGHELGHFRGLDTAYSKAFAPVYIGGRESLVALTAATGNWRGIAMLPATKMLEAFFLSFAESERTIGRTRELEADKAGAEAASAEAIATSLLKLDATAGAWGGVFEAAIERTSLGQPLPNLSDDFVSRAHAAGPPPDGDEEAEQARILHPFDTHPPTDMRLEALGFDRATLEAAAGDMDPADSAAALFGDRETLEASLTGYVEAFLRTRVPRAEPGAVAGTAAPANGPADALPVDAPADAPEVDQRPTSAQ
jgi:Zn-dependent protease with chaperone function